VGFVKNLIAAFAGLSETTKVWPLWWPLLLLPVGAAFWFLSNWQSHRDRVAQAMPRRVPVEGRDAPKANLAPCAPQRILIAFQSRDMEADMFANELLIAIANAGWHQCGPQALPGDTDFVGLRLEISDVASAAEKKSARALLDWLKAHMAGVSAQDEGQRFRHVVLETDRRRADQTHGGPTMSHPARPQCGHVPGGGNRPVSTSSTPPRRSARRGTRRATWRS
jgi:hypothetical protein